MLKAPDPALPGSGECSFLVSEEFALQKLGRQGGAVDGDEGLLRARAQRVDGLRGDLFAGAAFALYQDGRLAGGHLADGFENALHRGGAADHPGGRTGLSHLAPELHIFRLHLALPECPSHEHLEAVDIHRFGDKIVSSPAHRLHGRVHRSVGRHHDADGWVGSLQYLLHEPHAVIRPDFQISDEDIRGVCFPSGQCSRRVAGHVDLVMLLERRTQSVPRVFLVIDNENCFFHF